MVTFVVRVWVPAEPESESAEPVLRGLLEQVGSGRAKPFANGESLLALLREATRARSEDTASGDRKRLRGREGRR